MITQIEKQYLGLDKVQDIHEGSEPDILIEIAVKWDTRKQRFNAKRETAVHNGIRFKKYTPKWGKIERDIKAKIVFSKRDKTRKNALLLICEGIAYLDFINACQSGFSGRVEKCVQYFAILYQGSSLTNYAAETIQMVAYFKRLRNENFR